MPHHHKILNEINSNFIKLFKSVNGEMNKEKQDQSILSGLIKLPERK